jgi:hypothetical protein
MMAQTTRTEYNDFPLVFQDIRSTALVSEVNYMNPRGKGEIRGHKDDTID